MYCFCSKVELEIGDHLILSPARFGMSPMVDDSGAWPNLL